jgi:hypothetical protein
MKGHTKVACQFTKNRSTRARRQAENPPKGGEHTHTRRKNVKVKQNINAREGAQYTTNKTRIKAITTQTLNIKYLSSLHVRKDQRDPRQQKGVHNLPFEFIEISSRKWTTVWCGCRKSMLSINLRFPRFHLRSPIKRRFSPPTSSRRSSKWARLSSGWAISARFSSALQGTGHRRTGIWSICSKRNVTSPLLKRTVSPNQDHYGVPLPK